MLINYQQGTCLLSQLLSKVTVTSCRSSASILHGCLQQDGAPSHTARNTPRYLRRENVTFIDLNPLNCVVWGALQQTVYQRRRFKTINQLKQTIVTEWGKMLERFIDRAIGHWRHRLEWVVAQQVEQIEHLI